MIQNKKNLLLKDLCARLPYGVKCIEKTPIEDFKDKNLWVIDRIRADTFMFGMSNCYVCYGQYEDIDNIKPYLFPLSSMTEEQKSQYSFFLTRIIDGYDSSLLIDWFHKNHIDYRGLIPKGLANDATGLNIY